MGLDNGIILKHKEKIDFPDFINGFDVNTYISYNTYETDICYWRKCWNIRSAIAIALDGIVDSMDGGYTNIETPEQVNSIIDELAKFDEKSWDDAYDDGTTIWEWFYINKDGSEHGMKFNLETDLRALIWLRDYMRSNPDNIVQLYFYDSY